MYYKLHDWFESTFKTSFQCICDVLTLKKSLIIKWQETDCLLAAFFNLAPIIVKFKLCSKDINFYLEHGCESPLEESPTSDRLRFDRFDICQLLKHGASLLGSAGAEFEIQDDTSGINFFVICLKLCYTVKQSPFSSCIMASWILSVSVIVWLQTVFV